MGRHDKWAETQPNDEDPRPPQIIEPFPGHMLHSNAHWDDVSGDLDDYVDITELDGMESFIGLCKFCDGELIAPVNGDPLEPSKPYCEDCGWVRGEGEDSRYDEYQ